MDDSNPENILDVERAQEQVDRTDWKAMCLQFANYNAELIDCLRQYGHTVAGAAGMVSDREVVASGCYYWYETAIPLLNRIRPDWHQIDIHRKIRTAREAREALKIKDE